MSDDDSGCRKPDIDLGKCISCNLCKKICPNYNPLSYLEFDKKAYIAYYKNHSISAKSSSGGIFAALARHFLIDNGVVYGATIVSENGSIVCKHVRIDKETELQRLQGTKYIQSRMDGIYDEVKKDLASGKKILFSGTSCQVASLRNYVGEADDLYTVDLVCHGVPKNTIVRDYFSYLEKKNKGHIIDVSFRSKEIIYHGKSMPYVLTIKFESDKHDTFIKKIIRPNSSFYSLFMSRAGYRESCYNCRYASLQKPGDITLGDFRPSASERTIYNLKQNEYYSSVFVHSERGKVLLNAVSSETMIYEIPMDEMLKHHLNMQTSSAITQEGVKFLDIYTKGGFKKLQKHIYYNNLRVKVKKHFKRLLKM